MCDVAAPASGRRQSGRNVNKVSTATSHSPVISNQRIAELLRQNLNYDPKVDLQSLRLKSILDQIYDFRMRGGINCDVMMLCSHNFTTSKTVQFIDPLMFSHACNPIVFDPESEDRHASLMTDHQAAIEALDNKLHIDKGKHILWPIPLENHWRLCVIKDDEISLYNSSYESGNDKNILKIIEGVMKLKIPSISFKTQQPDCPQPFAEMSYGSFAQRFH
jgi:hypothetical protein